MPQYKISVLIPYYNAERDIAKTFASLLAQTIGFGNLEVIFVDDCSKDGSKAIVEKWAAQYENVFSYALEQNSGSSGAPRNRALDNAHAPYVMFLDADDVYRPSACETLYELVERTGCDVAAGDFCTVNVKDGKELSRNMSFISSREGSYDLSDPFTPQNEPFLSALWCKLFRRDIIEAHSLRMTERALFEELMFMCRYLTFCTRGEYVKQPITDYYVYDASVSHNRSYFFYLSTAKSLDEAIDNVARESRKTAVAEFMRCNNALDEHIDWLIAEDKFSDEQILNILRAWKRSFVYCADNGVELASPNANVLVSDMRLGGDERLMFDFLALREFYRERRTELEGIFNSRGYRIARRVSSVLGRRGQ